MAESTPKLWTNNDLNEDSLIFTPKPQATSTVDHRKANNLSVDLSYELLGRPNDVDVALRNDTSHCDEKTNSCQGKSMADSFSEDKFLVNERDLVGSLKKELDKVYADINRESSQRQSEATISSLGIINVDDVEDIGSKDDTSEVLESLVPNADDDCEMSWRMMRELARQSISSRRKSSLAKQNMTTIKTATVIPLKKFDKVKVTNDRNSCEGSEVNKSVTVSFNSGSHSKWERCHNYNPFDGERCSVVSVSSEEFMPAENMSARLLEDEKEWMKEKADIPVPVHDRSLSGIFPDDDVLSQASSFLRKGSGPLGDLDFELDPESRPNFGFSISSPNKSTDSKEKSAASLLKSDNNEMLKQIGPFNDLLDEVPTRELPANKRDNTCDLRKTILIDKVGSKNRYQAVQPLSTSILNDTAINDDRLSVSSVASITYIAELLGDMSVNTSPRHIIDKMLSAGTSKDKVSSNRDHTRRNLKNNCNVSTSEFKQKITKLNSIKEDSDKSDGVVSRLPSRRAEKEVHTDKEVISIDDSDDGKENLNQSIWTVPSRTSIHEEINKRYGNDLQIFKVPDSKKLIRRKRKDIFKNISVLSDATNTSCDLTVPDRRLTKNIDLPIIDVETNKTLVVIDDNNKTISNATESDNITRYSSSNLSSINDFNNQINMVNKDCNEDDIYDFEIMRMNKLPSYASSQELNSNSVTTTNDDVIVINDSTVNDVCKNSKLDESVVCLSNVNISCSFNDSGNANVSGDKDNSNIMPICVGTINRCTIPIFDSLSDECSDGYCIKCRWSIDDIAYKGKLVSVEEAKHSIVRLYFPEKMVLLKNRDSNNIEVRVVPLVADYIKVFLRLKITVLDENLTVLRSPPTVRCVLRIVGQHPQVTIQPKSLTETSVKGIDFGLLPEESMQKSFVKISNNGDVRVPILLEITKLSSDILIFYLMDTDNDGDDKTEKEVLKKLVILDPGETVEEPIYCFTPSLSSGSFKYRDGDRKIGQVSGVISVTIATTENDINLPKLAQLQLLALVGLTRVLIAANCNPLTIPASRNKSLVVRNAGVIPIVLKFHCDNPLFSVRGDHFISLEPDENGTVDIGFTPDKVDPDFSANSWKGTLWLSIVSSEIHYSVDLRGESQQATPITHTPSASTCSGSNPTTPLTSRSSSPCSSSGTSLSADIGPLELACTCSALVWASCPLLRCNNSIDKKSCVLRNKQNHREKLLLTISDPLSSYKIVEENGRLVSEMRLNLEAMESRQITVSFAPTQVGPCKGTLIITRVNRKSNNALPVPSQKKVLHLYGYGGKSVLNIKGVFRDPDLRMWTYLDSNTLQTTFTLENTGDGTAFVKLTQDIAAMGISIRPEECLIAAHKSIDVELTFSPTAGRADLLLNEPNSGEVLNVTRIAIMHGDEATRLRLKRLYCRLISEKQHGDPLLMERLAVLNNLFPGTSVTEVSCLKDKLDGMKTLWLEGVRESTLGVLLERSALENAQFDSTAQFIDLATTIMDETLCTTKLQQLIVAPRVVSISPAEPISSFSLRNTTVLQSRFHVEIPQPSFGITVEPQRGILPPHSSCLLTVKYAPGNDCCGLGDQLVTSSSSSVILKIHSDLMGVIEVPVNWRKA